MNGVTFGRDDLERFREIVSTWRQVPRDEVDDLIGDALLVYAERSRTVQIDKPLNWLLAVAARLRRKLSAMRKTRIKCVEIKADPEFTNSQNVLPEAVARLWRAIDGLRPEYRAAVEACDLSEVPPKEAAARLQCPYRTVQTHRRRAHHELARDPMLRSILSIRA